MCEGVQDPLSIKYYVYIEGPWAEGAQRVPGGAQGQAKCPPGASQGIFGDPLGQPRGFSALLGGPLGPPRGYEQH